MRFRGIRAPEDHQVGAVLYFAERAGDLTDSLKRHSRWTVTDGSGRIDTTANAVCNRHGHALRLASRIGKAIDDWVACIGQNPRRALDGLVQSRRLAVNHRHRPLFNRVIEEPRLAEHTGVLRLGDLVAVHGQFHVIADTAAKSAGGVFDDFQFRHEYS